MYLVFTRKPDRSYSRRLLSLLLCLCDVIRAPINSLVCRFVSFRPTNTARMYIDCPVLINPLCLLQAECHCACGRCARRPPGSSPSVRVTTTIDVSGCRHHDVIDHHDVMEKTSKRRWGLVLQATETKGTRVATVCGYQITTQIKEKQNCNLSAIDYVWLFCDLRGADEWIAFCLFVGMNRCLVSS